MCAGLQSEDHRVAGISVVCAQNKLCAELAFARLLERAVSEQRPSHGERFGRRET
ncbi:MAG: hypothetical protein RLZZ387_3469 [Chloroflexota bacterium]|jgi:hypothetical protein